MRGKTMIFPEMFPHSLNLDFPFLHFSQFLVLLSYFLRSGAAAKLKILPAQRMRVNQDSIDDQEDLEKGATHLSGRHFLNRKFSDKNYEIFCQNLEKEKAVECF